MQAYEGYLENGQFYPIDTVKRIPIRQKARLMILEEPEKKPKEDEQERRLAWLKRLDEAIDLSLDEELIYIPRSIEMRAPIDLTDEE